MKATLLNLRKTKMAKASVLLFMILMLSLSTALAQFTWTTTQAGFDQGWYSVTTAMACLLRWQLLAQVTG